MKKEACILSILIFLSLQLISAASAVEIQLTKEVYAPGETLQAEIYGNFIDGLKLENIYFYRERAIPLIYDILKLKDKYLLYAIFPVKEANYTIKIKDTRYTIPDGTSTDTIVREFEIKSTNEPVLTVSPGFIVARDDFFLKLKANKNMEIEAEFEVTGEKKDTALVERVEKKIYFSVSEIEDYTESNIKISDYNVPVFVFPEKSQEQIIQETRAFRFNPLEIKATILKKQDFSFKVSLLNLGDLNINEIELSSEMQDGLDVKIEPESISVLEAGDEKFIDLIFSSEKQGAFYGKVSATSESENLTTELDIGIYVTENQSEVSYETPSYTEEISCGDIGEICTAEEICNDALVPTQEGFCCQGTCVEEKEEESSSWIYGLIIIISVVLGLALLFFIMKKRQKKPEDILEKRKKKFEERMKIPKGEEIRGGLTKV